MRPMIELTDENGRPLDVQETPEEVMARIGQAGARSAGFPLSISGGELSDESIDSWSSFSSQLARMADEAIERMCGVDGDYVLSVSVSIAPVGPAERRTGGLA